MENNSIDDLIPLPKVETLGNKPSAVKKFLTVERIIMLAGGLVLVLLIVLFVMFLASSGRTAATLVNQKVSSPSQRVQQEIAQVSIPGSSTRSVLFYLCEEGISCAVLEQGMGGYKVISMAGSLSIEPDGKPGKWVASGENFNGRDYLVYGVLLDDKTARVEVNGSPAVLLDTGEYRCWFYVGNGTMSLNSDSVVYYPAGK